MTRDAIDIRAFAVGDRSVGAHDARLLIFQSAAEEPHASVDGLLDHCERGVGHGGHVVVGDVVIAWASNEIRYRGIA